MITVSIPSLLDEERVRADLPPDVAVHLVRWDLDGTSPHGVPADKLDVVVSPFHTTSRTPNLHYVSVERLAESLPRARNARLVQLLSLGFEGVADTLPPHAALSNAAGAMEGQTAELAVALVLTALRGLPAFATATEWKNKPTPGLLGRRIILLGHGGVGRQIVRRLSGFDVDLTVVARRARTVDGHRVAPVSRLPELLGDTDVLLCALPMTAETTGLVDAGALERLPDGALVVNVGRGPVIDHDALLPHLQSNRLSAALDVTDPEPLPAGHALWGMPNVLITPHVGGNTEVMPQLLHRLVATQITRLARGEAPANVVREVAA